MLGSSMGEALDWVGWLHLGPESIHFEGVQGCCKYSNEGEQGRPGLMGRIVGATA